MKIHDAGYPMPYKRNKAISHRPTQTKAKNTDVYRLSVGEIRRKEDHAQLDWDMAAASRAPAPHHCAGPVPRCCAMLNFGSPEPAKNAERTPMLCAIAYHAMRETQRGNK